MPSALLMARAMGQRLAPLVAVIRLLRPVNVLLFVVGALVGSILAGGAAALATPEAWWAALAASCIGAGANALNDAFDADIDAVNRPLRPIPSGRITIGTARWIWAALSTLGIAAAWRLSPEHVAMAVASVGLLYGYSASLKRVPVAGNVAVAAVVGLALVFGGMAAGSAVAALPGAAFAVLTTLSREIAKDVEDLAGDLAGGARTLAAVLGVNRACNVAIVPAALALVLAPLPFVLLDYPGLYLLMLLPAGLALAAAIGRLGRREPGPASTALKTAMALGLLALAIAGL